jgi:cation diffusion facilitator CzcD-associated flavoprotein CzcO
MWHIETDRGDQMKARFVICANGILTKPKLAKIKGLETFKGHSFSHLALGLRLHQAPSRF